MPGLRLREQKEALVTKAYAAADELIYQLQTGSLENDPGCNADETLEAHIIGSLSRVREQCGDICVSELSRHNAPLIMANCGSKGPSGVHGGSETKRVRLQDQRVADGRLCRPAGHLRLARPGRLRRPPRASSSTASSLA